MQVCFAFGLGEGLDDVVMLSSVGGAAAVARVGYQDDTYIVGSSSIIAAGFEDLEKSLAKVGHRMRRAKCSAWAPACDHLEGVEDLPLALRGLLERLPRARGGFKLLGGAVQGALEVDVTADEIGLQPALKRARRAAQLADPICEFAIVAPVPQTAHLAWLLLSRCVNHALGFDARLVGEEALAAANGIVENVLWPAMHAILSVDVTGAARRRMRISGAYGGCGLRGEASGAYAHAATLRIMQHGCRRPPESWRSRASWAGRSRGVTVGWRRPRRRRC